MPLLSEPYSFLIWTLLLSNFNLSGLYSEPYSSLIWTLLLSNLNLTPLLSEPFSSLTWTLLSLIWTLLLSNLNLTPLLPEPYFSLIWTLISSLIWTLLLSNLNLTPHLSEPFSSLTWTLFVFNVNLTRQKVKKVRIRIKLIYLNPRNHNILCKKKIIFEVVWLLLKHWKVSWLFKTRLNTFPRQFLYFAQLVM